MTEFQGHHANQACYKPGIISPKYHQKLLNPPIKPQAILNLRQNKQTSIPGQLGIMVVITVVVFIAIDGLS